MKVTEKVISTLAPKLAPERCKLIADACNQASPIYQVNTIPRMAAILSQIVHESGGFNAKNESLNYSAQGLIDTFAYYKKNPKLANLHGRTAGHPADQEVIANTVYADVNRDASRKLGNVQPNDGWYFRGAGPMQLTGRATITEYAKFKKAGIVLVVEELRTSDAWGIDSAFWFFVIYKKLLDEADRGDIKAISKAVNGGTNGLEERIALYQKALKVLGSQA